MIADEAFADSIAAWGGKELLNEVLDEFRMGWEREKTEAMLRQQRIGAACSRLESAAVEGLGHIDMDIPAESYFYWHHREPGCWKDKTFRREYKRDNPHVVVRYKNPKPFSAWTPARENTARQEPCPPTIHIGSKYGGIAG